MFPDRINWSDPEDIAHWMDHLWQKLNRRCSHIDAHLLDASIEDALLHYKHCPENFDPSRGSLPCYLEWRTRHYLDKRLQKEMRHCKHEKAAGVSDKIFEKIMSEMRARRGIS